MKNNTSQKNCGEARGGACRGFTYGCVDALICEACDITQPNSLHNSGLRFPGLDGST